MSVSQWTFNHSASSSHNLTTSTVIEGTSSLQLASTNACAAVVGLTSGANVNTIKTQTILRRDTTGAELYLGVFGLIQSSIAIGSSMYCAFLKAGDTANVYLNKTTASALQSTGTGSGALTSGANGISGGFLANMNYAIELKAQYDSGSGFVVLNVSVAPTAVSSPSTYDFSDLVTRLTYTDNSSAYSTGASAGIFRAQNDGGSKNVYFDKTRISRV